MLFLTEKYLNHMQRYEDYCDNTFKLLAKLPPIKPSPIKQYCALRITLFKIFRIKIL